MTGLRWGLVPLAISIVDTLIAYRVGAYVPASLIVEALVVAALFGLSASVAAFFLPTLRYGEFIAFMLVGIVCGAYLDAMMDQQDRTLIGIEIAASWVVSILPIVIGIRTGRWLEARTGRER